MTAMQAEAPGNTFRFRHSEALLRNVLENAAVATFLVGPNGRLLYANRAFRDLLGYSEDDPFTVVIDDLIHPDDLPNADTQMQALENGSADGYRAERRYVKKSGEPVWVLVSASALRDEATSAVALHDRPGDQHRQAEARRGGACRKRKPLEFRPGERRAGGLGPQPEHQDRVLLAHVAGDARHGS